MTHLYWYQVCLRNINNGPGPVFSRGLVLFCKGSYDATVRIWDCRARTFDPVQVMKEAKDSVTSMFLSLHEIVTGYVDWAESFTEQNS